MARIIVKHTSIIIEDYILGDCQKLESYFMIYNPVTHSYEYKGIEYIEKERKLILPRGIDIFFLEKLLETKAKLDTKHDEFDYVDQTLIKYLPRDDIQKQALRFTLGEGEYKSNKQKSQLAINLPTGKGKSYIAIMTMAYSCMRSIVITSVLNWLDQWKNYILEYTNISAKEIFFISGTSSIFSLLRKDISKYKVILASHNTIKSYGDTYGWDKVSELFKFMRVGIKFYDEAHLNFDNMCKIDYYTNTKYTMYITATPARSNEGENFIYQLYFKNVPSIDLFNEEEDPHTKYIAIKYNSHPSPSQLSGCKNQYGLDRNKYVSYIVHNENYYKMLHIILDLALKHGGKNLIYIGTNYGIKVTRDWIIENYPELKNEIGVYTSDDSLRNPDETKEQQLEKRLILSTTKSCGAAMDIKGLKMTIVLAEPFKSEVLAKQSLGRTRDKDTFYIEVVDTGFYHINKYYYAKKDIFMKYASECSDVTMSDKEINAKVENILNKRKIEKLNKIKLSPIRFLKQNEKIKVIKFV